MALLLKFHLFIRFVPSTTIADGLQGHSLNKDMQSLTMVARLCTSLLHKARYTFGYMYDTSFSEAPEHNSESRHTARLLGDQVRAIPQLIDTIGTPLTGTTYNFSSCSMPRIWEQSCALSKSRCVQVPDEVTLVP